MFCIFDAIGLNLGPTEIPEQCIVTLVTPKHSLEWPRHQSTWSLQLTTKLFSFTSQSQCLLLWPISSLCRFSSFLVIENPCPDFWGGQLSSTSWQGLGKKYESKGIVATIWGDLHCYHHQ